MSVLSQNKEQDLEHPLIYEVIQKTGGLRKERKKKLSDFKESCETGLQFHAKDLWTEIEAIRTANMADVESSNKTNTPVAKSWSGLQGGPE